jgi:hypothetical protein
MVKVNPEDVPLLVEAILLWTGKGYSAFPRYDDSQLINRFGGETTSKLFPIIKSLMDEFYSSDARYTAANLQEMWKMASEHFRKKHPEIPEQIVEAFAWCYTYDYK